MQNSNTAPSEVYISKGSELSPCLANLMERVGGIRNIIDNGDTVFIKFNLELPNGFPATTNLELLKKLIELIKDAGAEAIYLGSFPLKELTVKNIAHSLGLESLFNSLGAKMAYLDNSNYFDKKKIDKEKLKHIIKESFVEVDVRGNKIKVPKLIIDSDKIILVNQVNVDPLFNCRLSLTNYSFIVSNKYRKSDPSTSQENVLYPDRIKQMYFSRILDIFSIRKPDFIINDLFYVLEGAGPFNFRDSNLKKTGILIAGRDAISVDTITLKLLNVSEDNYDLLVEAEKRGLGTSSPSEIKTLGADIEKINLNIKKCVSSLEDIQVMNLRVNSGQLCYGCFKNAYYLLNFLKTYMFKDLKYIKYNNSFFAGINPPNVDLPEDENILIFGDCAIKITKDKDFRKIKKKRFKKTKLRKNENILEISGCPPDLFKTMNLLLDYYGKNKFPILNIVDLLNRLYLKGEKDKKLKIWEEVE
ncbi:MAG: DUF362 domain-containing protein [Candidatus Lokiarchaeota archaeon]|nr:DUF362 domain-containing protein [Candidatus Lokiarchaeota archaeon]